MIQFKLWKMEKNNISQLSLSRFDQFSVWLKRKEYGGRKAYCELYDGLYSFYSRMQEKSYEHELKATTTVPGLPEYLTLANFYAVIYFENYCFELVTNLKGTSEM